MELVLATDEAIIRNWDYAVVRNGNSRNKKSLTVTNKRIIITEQNGGRIDRNEFILDHVAGLSTHYSTITKSKRLLGILLLVAGVIVSIASLVWAIAVKEPGLYALMAVGLAPIVIGIVLLLRKKVFGLLEVTFQTLIPIPTMCYGLSATALPEEINQHDARKIVVAINFDIAQEIVQTLGAIVLKK